MLILCIADVERDVGMKNLSRKEAMEILNGMKVKIEIPKAAVTQNKRNAALDMAINALNCSEIPNNSDTIYRQQAIDVLEERLQNSGYSNVALVSELNRSIGYLMRLPSAQSEQQWVPCSERLPEEREWIGTKMFGTTISDEVYVTFEAPDGQRFTKHISFQNGKLSPADEKTMQVWFKGAKPIAWMPLPEPYQAERRENDGYRNTEKRSNM